MELPTHPEADDPPTTGSTGSSAPSASSSSSLWSRVLIGVLLGLVAVVVLLHLTGVVGPAGN
jgi:hypothetical protein